MSKHKDDSNDTSAASHIFACASLPEARRLVHMIHSTSLKTITITSQFAGEGKTFVTAVLAESAFRFTALRVLIIDAVNITPGDSFFKDYLPRPSRTAAISVLLAKNLRQGGLLSNIITVQEHGNQTINQAAPSDFDVGTYVASVRDAYDLILIDCCPLSSITSDELHPAILAHYSDSSLIVAGPQSLEQNALTSLKALIVRHNLMPVGFVYNAGKPQ